MRVLAFLVLVSCAGVVAAQKPAITEAAAKEAFRRLPKVKMNVTVPQLLKSLGLWGFRDPEMGRGSGPTNAFSLNYELTPTRRLALVIDYSKKPIIVKSAQAVTLPAAKR